MPAPLYAIGDIHGYQAELDRVLSLIEDDGGPDAHVIFLGDYTDRGPDSAAVLDTLVEGKAQGRNWTFLKGNHDRMFEWFMEVPPRHDPYMMVSLYWLHERLGGAATLESYGIDVRPDRNATVIAARSTSVRFRSPTRFASSGSYSTRLSIRSYNSGSTRMSSNRVCPCVTS